MLCMDCLQETEKTHFFTVIVFLYSRLQVLGGKEMEWKDKKALLKAKDQDQHRSKRDDVGCSSDESDEANQEEIAATDESQLMHLCDSRSLASTLSSGISDAGFLYKRLKVFSMLFNDSFNSCLFFENQSFFLCVLG